MSYTVKLATFPPWKAPIPYESLPGDFATRAEAAEAGARVLATIVERELIELSSDLQPRSNRPEEAWVTSVAVPATAVHGYLIFDEAGIEVSNWTTLDVALDRTANASSKESGDGFLAPFPSTTSS